MSRMTGHSIYAVFFSPVTKSTISDGIGAGCFSEADKISIFILFFIGKIEQPTRLFKLSPIESHIPARFGYWQFYPFLNDLIKTTSDQIPRKNKEDWLLRRDH